MASASCMLLYVPGMASPVTRAGELDVYLKLWFLNCIFNRSKRCVLLGIAHLVCCLTCCSVEFKSAAILQNHSMVEVRRDL